MTQPTRTIAVAALVAATCLVLAFWGMASGLFRTGPRDAVPVTRPSILPESAGVLSDGASAEGRESGGSRFPPGGDSTKGDSTEGRGRRASRGRVARNAHADLLPGGPSDGRSSSEDSSSSVSGDAKGKADLTTGLLGGEALTAAFEAALEAGDIGALQGLLISSLEKEGTKLAAEDLPLLLDALMGTDDYGLQKLALTHMERLDAAPDELAAAYMAYLEEGKSRTHDDEVFARLKDLESETALQGLTRLAETFEGQGSQRLKWKAVEALGDSQNPRAAASLVRGLDSAQAPDEVRRYADALARLGGEQAIGALVDRALRDDSGVALQALSRVKDPSAAPTLARALSRNTSEAFQKSALRKLSEWRDPATLPHLERYLEVATGKNLKSALYGLSKFPGDDAVRILERFASRRGRDSDEGKLAQRAVEWAKKAHEKNASRQRENEARKKTRDRDKSRRRAS